MKNGKIYEIDDKIDEWEDFDYIQKNSPYTTIARMTLIYNQKEYFLEYDCKCDCSISGLFFEFDENNFSCDCNRSIFLNKKYGDEIPILECGNKIKMKNLIIQRVLKKG